MIVWLFVAFLGGSLIGWMGGFCHGWLEGTKDTERRWSDAINRRDDAMFAPESQSIFQQRNQHE